MGHAQAAFPGSGAHCLRLLPNFSHAPLHARRVRYTVLTCAVYCLPFRPRADCGGAGGNRAAVAPSWTWAVGPHSPAA